MSQIPRHYLYERLMAELEVKGYRAIDPTQITLNLADTLSKLDPQDAARVEKIIYSIIIHHECLLLGTVNGFRKIAYGGKEITKVGGLSYNFLTLPAPIQQLLPLILKEILE